MSEISKGMTDADEKADKGGRNDIRHARTPAAAFTACRSTATSSPAP